MSDKDPSLIKFPELPDSIDNAVKNLTDKPTQRIGQTFSDLWFLVFGGITQAADKRRMKYAHDLELYGQELSQSIAAIPEENLTEPNIQTTAQALENSKYCIESEDLRKLFVNLISKSMDDRYTQAVHPSFAEIIKQMSPLDAKILKSLDPRDSFPLVDYILEDYSNNSFNTLISNVYIPSVPEISIKQACSSISSLSRLGIIKIITNASLVDDSVYKPFKETEYYKFLSIQTESLNEPKKLKIKKYCGCLTHLGEDFFEVCVQ